MSDREKFEKWMREQGAWEEYKLCLEQDEIFSLDEFLDGTSASYYISSAFDWECGGDYSFYDWNGFNVRWLKYLEAAK